MESTRPHTFRIIVFSFLCLLVGCLFGLGVAKVISFYKNKKHATAKATYENVIRIKRMRAISQAQKKGQDTYEFNVDFSPVLTKQ